MMRGKKVKGRASGTSSPDTCSEVAPPRGGIETNDLAEKLYCGRERPVCARYVAAEYRFLSPTSNRNIPRASANQSGTSSTRLQAMRWTRMLGGIP